MSAALAGILARPVLPKPVLPKRGGETRSAAAAPRPATDGEAAAGGGKRAAAAAAVPKPTATATATVLAPPPLSAKASAPAANTSGDPSRRHGGYAPVHMGSRLVENRVNTIAAVMQQVTSCSAACTLHPAPCTLHPAPRTLHPAPPHVTPHGVHRLTRRPMSHAVSQATMDESRHSVETLLSMLRELDSIRMTRDLLRATGVGKAINELRSRPPRPAPRHALHDHTPRSARRTPHAPRALRGEGEERGRGGEGKGR